jgi:hypothetical protein
METRDLDRIRFVTQHFQDLQGLRLWVPLGLVTLSLGGATYFSNAPWTVLRAVLLVGGLLLAFGARRYYRHTFGEVEGSSFFPAAEAESLSIYSPAGPMLPLEGVRPVTPVVQRFLLATGLAAALCLAFHAVTPAILVEVDESAVQPPWATLDAVFLAKPSWTAVPPSPSTVKAVLGQLLYALYGSFFLALWLWRGRRASQSYLLVFGAGLLGLSALGTCLGYFVWAEEPTVSILSPFVPAVIHLWMAVLLCGAAMIVAGLLDHRQLVKAMGR